MIDPISTGNSIAADYSAKAQASDAKVSEFEGALQKALSEKDTKKLKLACQNFEAVFANMMFKEMRSTVHKADSEQNNFAGDTYQDMLFEKYSDEIVKGKGLGLADMMYKQLSKTLVKKDNSENVK